MQSMAPFTRSSNEKGAPKPRVRLCTLALVLPPAAWLLSVAPSALSFATAPRVSPYAKASQSGALCGQVSYLQETSSNQLPTARSATATLSWVDPRSWSTSSAPSSHSDQLSPREWKKMYRTLGLPEDATRAQVVAAAKRLKRKYEDNQEATERLEAANLWILTKILAKKEETVRARQQANRLRELGDSPRRLFHKYIAGYVPPSIRQMIQPPDQKHFRWASGLLGTFALIGLCVPSQATNFVSLGAASTMGLVYQRNRPEPVKDDMGNPGKVEKPNLKEMGACIALVVLGAGLGTLLSFGVAAAFDVDPQTAFCGTACAVLWLVALFFKVYKVFDPDEA
eukprot:TRINITY_DN71562_c0_g1_i1.p1 TRINITY_DN71562_c0_g1~~TRINITY_DN71562_c0_g1_i1.p1  ORF type:complete len:340 (-),score=68.91 TRINITY_DN71562_c0_g1_i1:34-1053(-)